MPDQIPGAVWRWQHIRQSHRKNVFGEEDQVLYVKGSGWGLEAIAAAGFAPVRLEHLKKLAQLPALSDPETVNQLVTHQTHATAPAPSVEAILHCPYSESPDVLQ